MKNRQIDQYQNTFQLRVGINWREALMKLRATDDKSMRQLVEEALEEHYGYKHETQEGR